MKKITVKKFGGTSLGTLDRIEDVAKRVLEDKANQNPVVVVSAMSGETNKLVDMADTMYPGYRGPCYDMILASGEQVSVGLLCMAIGKSRRKCKTSFSPPTWYFY